MTINLPGALGINNPNQIKEHPAWNLGTCDGPKDGGIAGKTKLPFPFGTCDGPDQGGIMGKVKMPSLLEILTKNQEAQKQNIYTA